MGKILSLLLLCATCRASTVHMQLTNWPYLPATNTLQIFQTQPSILGNYLAYGNPIRIQYTNSAIYTNFFPGVYELRIVGFAFSSPILFPVPDCDCTNELAYLLTLKQYAGVYTINLGGASSIVTNGISSNGQLPISTNTALGYFWGQVSGGGGSATNSDIVASGDTNIVVTTNGLLKIISAPKMASTNLVQGVVSNSLIASLNSASNSIRVLSTNAFVQKVGDTLTGNYSFSDGSSAHAHIYSANGTADFNDGAIILSGGIVEANEFFGSGDMIVGVIADNLTPGGTFPQEDGSALTALNASQLTTGTVGVNVNASTVTAKHFLRPTNVWTINGPIGIGTNLTYVASGTATFGVTTIQGAMVTGDFASLDLFAEGATATFTNPVSMHASDGLTSRVISNRFSFVAYYTGWTNSAAVHFP